MKSKQQAKPVTGGRARVPVVMQLEALECGAACLTMVLAYYGKWLPLEQVRADCGVSRDGSNARNILRAARAYGLEAEGYRMEPADLKAEGTFPCIVHWDFNHFVVLCGFKGGKVYLNDPARGSVIVTEAAFDESFTGVCLTFEPSADFVPGGRPHSVLSFIRERMTGITGAAAFVSLTGVLSTLIGIIKPGFSRVFLDRLLTGENPDWAGPFLYCLLFFSIAEIMTEAVTSVSSLRINGKLSLVSNSTFMWKVLRLPMEFFSQRMAGDILQRQETNASIAGTLVNTLGPLLLNMILLIFYLVVMLRYSVMLTLIGLLSIVINFVTARLMSAMRVNRSRVLMRTRGKLYSATVSGIEMIESIKSAGAENGYFERWAGYQAQVNADNLFYGAVSRYYGMIPNVVRVLSDSLVLAAGVHLVLSGRFTAGMVMAFQGYLSAFVAPAQSLTSAVGTFQEMRSSMERVEDVMNYPDGVPGTEQPLSEKTEYDKLSGALELRNVTFGYARLDEPLIRNFSLNLQPGGSVAFVGGSGCGKSTLSKLITGLYSPWSGEILFDGKPISEIDRAIFTGSVAVVDQDITLFEDTVANNIRMWDNSIEDFEVIMAARDAQLHDEIISRPGGYQRMLTEGGRDLSGGQRQRLEIARVLAQDPTIVIMDEATSALDARTEHDVVQAVRARGITTIVIAHRLSTVRDCDEIIVLDHGSVAERGTHEELMARGGLYAQLVANE